jgi:predicted helicase
MSVQNTARIQQQNDRTISVIIGNPPYNAHQENFNQRNANRGYGIDQAIKSTYIKEGTAQNQIVVYDMYTRFFRWASNRLGKNGIIAFITNRSYIDAKAFDGFRKCIEREFDHIYIVDIGGDIRSGDTSGNVFDIKLGVAVMFLVKTQKEEGNAT